MEWITPMHPIDQQGVEGHVEDASVGDSDASFPYNLLWWWPNVTCVFCLHIMSFPSRKKTLKGIYIYIWEIVGYHGA
jgi:hypothetical protein